MHPVVTTLPEVEAGAVEGPRAPAGGTAKTTLATMSVPGVGMLTVQQDPLAELLAAGLHGTFLLLKAAGYVLLQCHGPAARQSFTEVFEKVGTV